MHEDPHPSPLPQGAETRARSFAILPAAGRSVRMGVPKLLLPFRGQPLIVTVLASWRASRVDGVVLVVHPDDTEIAELGRQQGAEVVVPSVPPPDMKASVERGLERVAERWAPADSDAWLVAPADMPLLTPSAINAVLSVYEPTRSSIVVPRHDGRRGHPLALSWSLAVEVARLAANEGLNALIARHEVQEVELSDSGILVDLDTAEDFRRLGGHLL